MIVKIPERPWKQDSSYSINIKCPKENWGNVMPIKDQSMELMGQRNATITSFAISLKSEETIVILNCACSK